MANITYRNILLRILIVLVLICCLSCNSKRKVTYGDRSIIEINIDEIKDPTWSSYSYFWQQGKDKDGKDLTIVTIYWTKPNKNGISTYITDGKKWEELG